jgi:hypothetical protein
MAPIRLSGKLVPSDMALEYRVLQKPMRLLD